MPSPNVFGLSGSKIDWEKMLEKVMNAYKKRLDGYELTEWETQQKIDAWQMFRKKLQELRAAAKFIYDPVNGPFNQMKVDSTDEKAFSATTNRTAKPGKYKIDVKQVASPDVFQSDEMTQDKSLPKAVFTLRRGKKQYEINFGGGPVATLIEVINRVAGQIVEASTINIDGIKVALVIKGKKSGRKNKIYFEKAHPMLFQIGLLTKKDESLAKINFDNKKAFRTRKGTVHVQNSQLVLTPESVSEHVFDNNIRVKAGYTVEFTTRLIKENKHEPIKRISRKEDPQKPGKQQKDVEINNVNIGTIDNFKIGPYKIHGETLKSKLEAQKKKEQEKKQAQENKASDKKPEKKPEQGKENIDTGVLIFKYGGEIIKKIHVKDIDKWKKYSVTLDDINGRTFDRVVFVNNNKNRRVEFNRLVLTDGENRIRPKHYVSKAKDAIIKYNGIKIKRPTNNIEKLIKGVTIQVRRRTNGPETLNVDYDVEKLVKSVQEFIIHYNNAMDFIWHVTQYKRRRELKKRFAWKKEVENMDDKKKERLALTGKLYEGLLAGDMTVSTIKNKLRQAMMNPYPTTGGNQVKFFTQIGLHNASYSANPSEEERRNLRAGYFQFKDEKFKEMLNKQYQAIKDFFANDTDGDMVKDNGLSIQLNKSLQYIASQNYRAENGRVYPGLIENRISVQKSYLKNNKKRTERFKKQMLAKRERMIRQIRRAEQASQRSQSIRKRLEGFQNNSGSGR